jgi:hypothetical protein
VIDGRLQVLCCVECGTAAPPGAWKWKTELAGDPLDDETPEVALYCPICHAREFGGEAKATRG